MGAATMDPQCGHPEPRSEGCPNDETPLQLAATPPDHRLRSGHANGKRCCLGGPPGEPTASASVAAAPAATITHDEFLTQLGTATAALDLQLAAIEEAKAYAFPEDAIQYASGSPGSTCLPAGRD